MKKLSQRVLSIMLLAVLVFSVFSFTGCESSLSDDSLDNYLVALGKGESAEASYTSKTLTKAEFENLPAEEQAKFEAVNEAQPGVEYYPKYVKYETSGGFDQLTNYGQYDSTLYPGAIVDISKPTISAINLQAAPVTLSLDINNNDNKFRPYVVRKPSLSAVRTGVNELVSTVGKDHELPARVSISTSQVDTKGKLDFALGIGGGYNGIHAGFDINFGYEQEWHETVVVLKQVLYTVNVDRHVNPSNYFAKSNGSEKVKAQLEGKIPVVVSSVEYGRVAVARLRTKKSMETLGFGVDFSYADIVNFETKMSSAFSASDFKCDVFVYGGTVNDGSALGSQMSLADVIREFSADYNPPAYTALPITYKLSHLSDYTLAKVATGNDQMYIKQMVKKYHNVRFHLDKIELYDGGSNVTGDIESIGNLKVKGNLIQENGSDGVLYTDSIVTTDTANVHFKDNAFEVSNFTFDLQVDNEHLLEDYLFFTLDGTTFTMKTVETTEEKAKWWRKFFLGEDDTTTVTNRTFNCTITGGKIAGMKNLLGEDTFYFDAQPNGTNSKIRLYFTTEYLQ